MTRRQWFALDVNVFDNDLTIGLREEFGTVGLCMWVGFLAACKRNVVQGKIRYSSDAECLSLMGLPALELIDEEGEPFKLDDFWTYLGRHKQTSVTRRKRLTDITATRWEQWQKSAKRDEEAERKRRSRAESERTDDGHNEDALRTDRDIDKDRDTDRDADDGQAVVEEPLFNPSALLDALFDAFWSEYPIRVGKPAAKKAWDKAVKSTNPERIIEGANRYAENVAARGVAREYIAHPSTWLNREGWDDELPEPAAEPEGVKYR